MSRMYFGLHSSRAFHLGVFGCDVHPVYCQYPNCHFHLYIEYLRETVARRLMSKITPLSTTAARLSLK